MADPMQKYADKTVEKLGRKIDRTYRQAAREINRKMKSFWDSHKAIDEKMRRDVREGRITEQDYRDWLRNQVFIGDRWQSKLDQMTRTYMEADKEARKMVGETDRDVFVHAANWQAGSTSRAVNGAVSFDMYDRKTVDRLIRDNPKMLPEWKINEKKDYIWNEKRVRNAVTQGIMQGESVYDIGKRLTNELTASNASKMDMFARTAVTGAQNAGRIERLHEAEKMGIKVRKKWLSAHDDRVRDTHAALDGQEVDVDKPFTIDGMTIDYPGDPTAPPELVYNCRCTMIYVYPEYQKNEPQAKDKNANSTDKISSNNTQKESKSGFKSDEKDDIISFEEPIFSVSGSQFGKKVAKHAEDFGLDASSTEDRQKIRDIMQDIFDNADEVCTGEWRGQKDPVRFYIKGDDVVLTKQDGSFITILKGGVNNARVKKARGR